MNESKGKKERTLQAVPAPNLQRDHRIGFIPQHIIHQLLRFDHPKSPCTTNKENQYCIVAAAMMGERKGAKASNVLIRRQLLNPNRRTALPTPTRHDIIVLNILRRNNAHDRALAHHLAEANEVWVWSSAAACCDSEHTQKRFHPLVIVDVNFMANRDFMASRDIMTDGGQARW